MPIFERAVRLTTPPSRLYVIGHPGGRDLELSLHDNHLLGCNDRLLHYRTPTEAGSSGSPVFEADGWRVVGCTTRAACLSVSTENSHPTRPTRGSQSARSEANRSRDGHTRRCHVRGASHRL